MMQEGKRKTPHALAPEMLALFTVRPHRCQSLSGSRRRSVSLGAKLVNRGSAGSERLSGGCHHCSSVPYQAGDLA